MATFYRPSPISSGCALIGQYDIKKKPLLSCDQLIDDLILRTEGLQLRLEEALEKLDNSNTDHEFTLHRMEIEKLKSRVENLLLKIQLCAKISAEKDFVKSQLSNINILGGGLGSNVSKRKTLRKRLTWLDQRLRHILTGKSVQKRPTSVRFRDRESTPQTPVNHATGAGGDSSSVSSSRAHQIIDSSCSSCDKQQQQPTVKSILKTPTTTNTSVHTSDTFLTTEVKQSTLYEHDTHTEEGQGDHTAPSPSDTPVQTAPSPSDTPVQTAPSPSDTPVEEYWVSEHHEFYFNQHYDQLMKVNNVSYHRLGLAVCGSFLPHDEFQKTEIPWRQQRAGSIDFSGVQKVALEKLAEKIATLLTKVSHAAYMTSDQLHPSQHITRERTYTSIDNDMLNHASVRPSRQKESSTGSSSNSAIVTLPRIRTSSSVKSSSDCSIHNNITTVAPHITNTADECYPRCAADWVELSHTETLPPPRVVNQHNLKAETQFKLYTCSKKDESSSEEQHILNSSNIQLTEEVQWTLGVLKRRKPAQHATELKQHWLQEKINSYMLSDNCAQRKAGATYLGMLNNISTNVTEALSDSICNDSSAEVCLAAAKSLIGLGVWRLEAMKLFDRCLREGNRQLRWTILDVLHQSVDNVQHTEYRDSVKLLTLVLLDICTSNNTATDTDIQLQSALCLARMAIYNERSLQCLYNGLTSVDRDTVSKALFVLVMRLHIHNKTILDSILNQLNTSTQWKHRACAAYLLVECGPDVTNNNATTKDHLFTILQQRLWDDPNKEVRRLASDAITALGMRKKAVDLVQKNLEDKNEQFRSEAVISVGTLALKSHRFIKLLLEMVELDPSDAVRLQIIRTFGVLGITDAKIIRTMKDKERGAGGILGREATRTLKQLGVAVT